MRLRIIITIFLLALLAGLSSAATVDFSFVQGEDSEWLSVEFTGTVSNTGDLTITSWYWDFRDGSTSTAENPTHTFIYETSGDLTQSVGLTLTMSDNSTLFTEKNIMLVYPSLDAEFSITPASKTGYAPLEVSVVDTTVGPHNLEWDWGDTTAHSSISEDSHTYETPGTYSLILTVTRGTDSDVTQKEITVKNPTVSADFSADKKSGIVPLTVEFTDESSGAVSSWAWEIEGGISGSGETFTHTFDIAGNYSVKLSVIGTGGESDTEEKLDYIRVTPNITAGFTAKPTSGENPLTVQFTDISKGYNLYESRYWDFGDDKQSTAVNPEHVYAYAGSYDVSLTVTNDQGSVTITKKDYIVVSHEDTPAPTATTAAPTYVIQTETQAPDSGALNTAANSENVGKKIFGIPGTEFIREEISRIYNLYKEYLFMITNF